MPYTSVWVSEGVCTLNLLGYQNILFCYSMFQYLSFCFDIAFVSVKKEILGVSPKKNNRR